MAYQPQMGRFVDEPLKNHPEFRWRRKLGEEAYGSVVEAEEIETGRLVAIKLMDVQQVALMKTYVVRDVTEHAKCGAHPNVIQYLKCLHTEKHLGVVTQYAAGGDLMSVISARKGLGEEEARRLFRQLLVGLDFCTRMGLSNHDVRLENTLLSEQCSAPSSDAGRVENGVAAESSGAKARSAAGCAAGSGGQPREAQGSGAGGAAGEVPSADGPAGEGTSGEGATLKLCAFGPSIRAHHSQPWRQDGGSLCYNPPEALISRRFEAMPDEATTVWICGVFLYAMLCNQYPFGDASNVRAVLDVRERMMKADFGRPADRELSGEAMDLLSHIFVADPKQRISMSGIQAHPWVAGGAGPLDLEAINALLAKRCQAAWTPEAEAQIAEVVAQAAAAAIEAMGSGDLNEAELDEILDEEDYEF